MSNETITAAKGFRCAGVSCGIKVSGRLDMGLLVADVPCHAAAMFTQNRFCGAPVTVGRAHVADGVLQAVVVNSGVSNVATGQRGIADAEAMCQAVAQACGIEPTAVLPSSTGVIGAFLPMKKILAGIKLASRQLSGSVRAGRAFTRAIMTTDTRPKTAVERFHIGKTLVTIAGTAKGSGMIAPNMATMLSFLTTDANIPKPLLRKLLRQSVEPTFNRMTVDACQSTSDTVAILASGLAGNSALTSAATRAFADALRAACESLARQVAADGEGASKTLEVFVAGARTARDAHVAARAVADSMLVKTAVHGGDPNWGRIAQAIGACGVPVVPERMTIRIGDSVIFRHGRPDSRADLKDIERHMKSGAVTIAVDLGMGRAADRVLTCDLSRGYIRINADYHT